MHANDLKIGPMHATLTLPYIRDKALLPKNLGVRKYHIGRPWIDRAVRIKFKCAGG
jgi:hypothetical protein